MTENKHKETLDRFYELFDDVINQLVNKKINPEEVKKSLIQKGMDTKYVGFVIEYLEKQIYAAKKNANKSVRNYKLWYIGAIIIVLATYFWALV